MTKLKADRLSVCIHISCCNGLLQPLVKIKMSTMTPSGRKSHQILILTTSFCWILLINLVLKILCIVIILWLMV